MNADTDPSGPLACLARVRAVLRHPGPTDRERVVLAELATHDQSRFVPTVDVLARFLYSGPDERRNRDFCRRVLRSLEAKGVLSVEYRDGRVVQYVIKVDDTEPVSDAAPSTLTPAECQVTPSECRSDTEPVALSSKKGKKREKKTSDTERVSPKLRGGYRGKSLPRQSEAKRTSRDKALLQALKKRDSGLTRVEFADSLGVNFIDIETEVNALIEANSIHVQNVLNCDRYFFGPKVKP